MVRYASHSDSRLLRATQRGRADAFGAFFERHVDVVVAYLRRRTSSADEAADLVAETFAAALLSVHRGSAAQVTDGAPWLVGIARNKLVDSHRRGQTERSARRALKLERPPLTAEDEARFDLSNAEHGLARAIDALTDAERQAVLERIVLERGYGDIAGAAQESEVVIRKRVSRALLRMRESIGART